VFRLVLKELYQIFAGNLNIRRFGVDGYASQVNCQTMGKIRGDAKKRPEHSLVLCSIVIDRFFK